MIRHDATTVVAEASDATPEWGGASSPQFQSQWDSGVFRLAIDANGLDRDRAYELLSAAVHHFLTRRLETADPEAMRAAAGVLRRARAWAAEDPYNLSAPYHVDCLARAFLVWHHYRELWRAVEVRHDLLVRMRGASDELILASVFNEEGRTILAAHVRGFLRACSIAGLEAASLRRSAWIANLIVYRTRDGEWEATAPDCLRLCTDLLRELGGDATLHELRGVTLAAWNSLSLETNHLRDVFAKADDDRASLLAEIDERFAALIKPSPADVVYFPGDYSYVDPRFDRRARAKRFVF